MHNASAPAAAFQLGTTLRKVNAATPPSATLQGPGIAAANDALRRPLTPTNTAWGPRLKFVAASLCLLVLAACGEGSTSRVESPVKRTAAGGWHSFAIRSDGSVLAWGSNRNGRLGDGSVWTWGDNVSGQLGDGTLISRTSPVVVVPGVPTP